MARERRLKVTIVGDASSLERAMGKTDQAVGRFESMGKKMQQVGKKMSMFVTAPVLAGGAAAFKMAGDFGESLSKMNTVFGESGREIEKWAKGAAKNLGLSRKEAIDAAGTFGNMFTQLGVAQGEAAGMSKQMIQLATDLGSFHNADITEVIEAQSSAFRGEYDALQRYIPTINAATVEQKALEMTGKATTKELTAQEKAIAVQKLMMEGAGAAMGDFARTSDSATNQQRIATAQFKDAATTLGTKLLPIGQKIIGWLSTLAEWFGKLSPGVQTAILVVVGLVAALGPLIGIIGSLSVAIGFLAANPIVLVIAAIAALAAGLVVAYKKSETFRDVVDAVFRVVTEAAGWLRDRVVTAIDFISNHWRTFATLFGGPVGIIIAHWDTLKRVALEGVTFIVDKFLAMAEWVVRAAAKAFGWVPGVGPKLREAAGAIERFRDEVNTALGQIHDKDVKIRLSPYASDAEVKASTGTAVRSRYHTGGPVPGVGSRDTVPAMLTPGEYVIRKDVVRKLGPDWLEHLNKTGELPYEYARGGPVDIHFKSNAGELEAAIRKFAIENAAPALGAGIGWRAMWDAVRKAFPWAKLISAFRPGARTRATGRQSYHALGRAIDVSPSMEIAEWWRRNFKAQTKELIYSPMGGRQIHNGRDHYYTGVTRADHWSHVHAAMAGGAVVDKPTFGYVGEAGQREFVSPESLLRQVVREEVGDIVIPVTLAVDGEKMTQVVIKHQRRYAQRNGQRAPL